MNTHSFPKLSWTDWQAKYRPHIRTRVIWDKIQRPAPKVGRTWVCDQRANFDIFYPWYKSGGDWRDRDPLVVDLSRLTNDVVVQVPALLVNTDILLLDGNHRVRDLRPRVLIIDWIDVGLKRCRYFSDCYAESHMERWNP
jgi:hypothetical protein